MKYVVSEFRKQQLSRSPHRPRFELQALVQVRAAWADEEEKAAAGEKVREKKEAPTRACRV